MSTENNHPYHLVDVKLLSILGALSSMISVIGIIKWFHFYNYNLLLLEFMITTLIMIQFLSHFSEDFSMEVYPHHLNLS